MATSKNHKLFKLSGKRGLYYDVIKDENGQEKMRENGVIKEQAYTDIIIHVTPHEIIYVKFSK